MLLTVPNKSYGLTLNSLNMVIKLFKESRGNEGATFVVYLHELAHFPQRADFKTFGECNSPTSQKKGIEEGGFQLENELFDTQLFFITYEAAEYIFESNIPADLEIFKSTFKNLNQYIERDPNGTKINLSRTGSIIYFGTCGNRYGKFNKNRKK
jgi:hypothetical protein